MSTTAIAMTSFDSSHLPLTTKSPAMVGKHTPFCGNNCSFLHHNLVTALLIDGRKAASRIHPCTGDLPSALKVAIDSATSAGWDQNCFIPDPLDQLRCPLLFLACAFGKFAVVQGLLRNDFIANVLNEHGETALHFAAKHFHVNKGNVSFDREGAFEKVLHCLTEDSPKLLAAQDNRGFTPFHVSAISMKFEGRSYHKKIRFHQFCLKSMIKRLVELEKASIFTRHEARDIIKTPDIHGLDSVLHILARRSENFDLLKFARDSLFQGRFPENKNKEGQTVLSLAWSTDPRGAMNTFHFSSDIPSLQEVDFIGEKNQDHLVDKQPTDFDSDPEESVLYIDKVFSLSSVGGAEQAEKNWELYVSNESSEDAITVFTGNMGQLLLQPGNENLVIHQITDDVKKQEKESTGNGKCTDHKKCFSLPERNGSASLPPGLSEASCVAVVPLNQGIELEKVNDADSSFMEFVVTEGLGLEPEAKKNIVEVVMSQYSNNLRKVRDKLSQVGQRMQEEESAVSLKKTQIKDLEEELALLKKDLVVNEKCLEDLRKQSKVLGKEEKLVKRKVSLCLEMQNQLDVNLKVKKVRLE